MIFENRTYLNSPNFVLVALVSPMYRIKSMRPGNSPVQDVSVLLNNFGITSLGHHQERIHRVLEFYRLFELYWLYPSLIWFVLFLCVIRLQLETVGMLDWYFPFDFFLSSLFYYSRLDEFLIKNKVSSLRRRTRHILRLNTSNSVQLILFRFHFYFSLFISLVYFFFSVRMFSTINTHHTHRTLSNTSQQL